MDKERYIKVKKMEFDNFIKNYPRPLKVDVCGIYEPPLISYNDFSEGKVWSESVVAFTFLYETNPNNPYYVSDCEKKYFILRNKNENRNIVYINDVNMQFEQEHINKMHSISDKDFVKMLLNKGN